MSDPKHVLFVCTGNTCRSPMAEGLFRKALVGRGDLLVSSAGVAATRGGLISPETQQVLKRRDAMLLEFRSQPVNAALLKSATHVFAMSEAHLAALEARHPEYAHKYFLVREFAGEKPGGSRDVPDPIGMGMSAYEEVAKLLDAAIPSIIAYVDSTEPPQATR
jgi:protein-tyrosine-phosphatase